MKRIVKVRIKRMFVNAGRDLRKESLAFTAMVGTEVGAFVQEFLKGLWEGLTGPSKPVRRRRQSRGRSW